MPEYDACLYRVDQYKGRDCLEAVPLDSNTNLPIFGEVVEVTNVDDDANFVKCVNELFGTSFTMDDFPGR